MLDTLASSFLGSSQAKDLLGQLTAGGLGADQAKDALSATVEGAASSLGAGGVASAVGGLLGGGGGLGGLLGGGASSLLGGGAAGLLGGALGGGSAPAGLPAAVVDPVVAFVASKTGLSEAMARQAVNVALPQVMQFVKSKIGG